MFLANQPLIGLVATAARTDWPGAPDLSTKPPATTRDATRAGPVEGDRTAGRANMVLVFVTNGLVHQYRHVLRRRDVLQLNDRLVDRNLRRGASRHAIAAASAGGY